MAVRYVPGMATYSVQFIRDGSKIWPTSGTPTAVDVELSEPRVHQPTDLAAVVVHLPMPDDVHGAMPIIKAAHQVLLERGHKFELLWG